MLDDLFLALPVSAFPVAVLAIVGLVIGSYLNVAIYRIPAGISTVFPGSRCPRCLMAARPFDNIPVVSYLCLLARCRFCRGSISVRYPLIEISSSMLFVLSYRRFPNEPLQLVVTLFFVALLVVLAMIDWDHRQVPLMMVVVFSAAILLGQAVLQWVTWTDAWIGALGGAASLAALSEIWRWFKGHPGFAEGDIWVLAMIGACLGWQGALASFALAALLAILVSTLGWSLRRSGFESVPFVSFMAVGALVVHLVPAWT